MKVRHLRCPNCGAALDAEDDDTVVQCDYCGDSLQLVAPTPPPRAAPPPPAPPPPPSSAMPPAAATHHRNRWFYVALVAGIFLFGGIPTFPGLAGAGFASSLAASDIAEMGSESPWTASASKHRGQNGSVYQYECPANGLLGPVWGSGPYTDDSSVCTAGCTRGSSRSVKAAGFASRSSPDAAATEQAAPMVCEHSHTDSSTAASWW